MDHDVVQAWINDVNMADRQADEEQQHQQLSPPPQQLQPQHMPALKRARISQDDHIAALDLDRTPVRLPRAAASASSFALTLASRPVFSEPSAETSWTHHHDNTSSTRSRSSSPSKRFKKVDALLNLAVPKLLAALAATRKQRRILPASLRLHPDFGSISDDVEEHMWNDDNEDGAEGENATRRAHDELKRIVSKAVASANKGRSESSWNSLVHTPILEHATHGMDFVQVEPIMAAHIMPVFHPRLPASGEQIHVSSSAASSSAASTSAPGQPTAIASASSDHKMVDYALTLQPDDALATLYSPLRSCPAPIFIETKTATATSGSDGSVQLGVWLAAWHARMRSLAPASAPSERMLTLPMIQLIGNVWLVMHAVDEGAQIRVVYSPKRTIGETNSLLGIYELRASLQALGRWVKDTFEPWFTELLSRALEGRGS
ncbi:Methyltransferase type 11 [Cordyceps javanica]|nr:Methyltransferase type 11 [Cordyceps javanica]